MMRPVLAKVISFLIIVFYVTNALSATHWSIQNVKLTDVKQLSNGKSVPTGLKAAQKFLYTDTSADNNLDKALYQIKKAVFLSGSHLSAEDRNWIMKLVQRASILVSTDLASGRFIKGERECEQLLVIYRLLNSPHNQYVYQLLADINLWKGNLDKKLYYNLEALKSMITSRDTGEADQFYYGVGCTYAQLRMYDKGAPFLIKALDASKKNPHSELYHYILEALVPCLQTTLGDKKTLVFLGQRIKERPPLNLMDKRNDELLLGDLHAALANNKDAEIHYLKLLQVDNDLDQTKQVNYTDYAYDLQRVCGFYIKLKRFDRARIYLTKIKRFHPRFIEPRTEMRIQRIVSKIDSASGSYLSSLRHFERFHSISDSLISVTKSRQIAEIQTKYETARKDKNIQLQAKDILLLEKQSQLQESQASKVRMNLTLVVLSLLIILSVGCYIYRLKLISTKKLKIKQVEVSRKNMALDKLLVEKEWLLKEIHHRVKNNLQIVISLLNTQAIYLNNNEALDAIRESQHRMHSISLIHQKLYQSDNSARIEMDDYVSDLLTYLVQSFDLCRQTKIILEVGPISLDVVHAVPMGLILNEAVTNTFKYAFTPGTPGTINIALYEREEGMLELVINDNGRGLQNDFDLDTCASLGMSLMKGLTKQLHGKMKISGPPGLTIAILISIPNLEMLISDNINSAELNDRRVG